MSAAKLSPEERRALTNARQYAVRNAWKNEQQLVREGKGTRDWTPEEQKELLESGTVDGYEGHHMKSVSEYPDYAGDPDNIQFLSEDEHLYGAHQGSYHNATNGYYDPNSQAMEEFNGDELQPVEARDLSSVYVDAEDPSKDNDYVGSAEESNETEKSGEDYTGEWDQSEANDSDYLGSAEESSESIGDNGESAESDYGID